MKIKSINKAVLSMLLFAILAVSLAGCGTAAVDKKTGTEGSIDVVTTIFPQYDFAKAILGDKGSVSMILPPGAESHSFEPTAQDILKIQNADLFIYIGGHGDAWVEEVLDSMGDNKPKTLKLIDLVKGIKEEDEHGHGDIDEHIWTSPKNAIILASKIADEIGVIDKANEDFYKANKADYIKKLEDLDKEFKKIVDGGKRNTIVMGDRFSIKYFVEEYGLNYYAAFTGCGGESEPSASEMAKIVKAIKKEKIPVVMYIEFSNQKIADAIAETTKVKTMMFHSCHNVSKEEIDKGATYLNLMKANMNTLKEALN